MKKITITFLTSDKIREKDIDILMDIGIDMTGIHVADYDIKIEAMSDMEY